MLLLRQGRRQTGPPSSECELQGSDARGRLLVLSCGWPTRVQRSPCLKPQTLVRLLPTQPRKKGRNRRKINKRASRFLVLRENVFTDVLNKNTTAMFS